MDVTRSRLLLAAGALLCSITGCHGSTPNSSPAYVPAAPAVGTTGGSAVQGAKDRDITSTCRRRIHIEVLGFVDCKFDESNYNGNFHVFNHTRGLVSINPDHGNKDTTFVVTGLVVGHGTFLVRDLHNNRIVMRVRVTL